jgi:hypothetical protein
MSVRHVGVMIISCLENRLHTLYDGGTAAAKPKIRKFHRASIEGNGRFPGKQELTSLNKSDIVG